MRQFNLTYIDTVGTLLSKDNVKHLMTIYLKVVVLNMNKGDEDSSDDAQVLPQTPQVK